MGHLEYAAQILSTTTAASPSGSGAPDEGKSTNVGAKYRSEIKATLAVVEEVFAAGNKRNASIEKMSWIYEPAARLAKHAGLALQRPESMIDQEATETTDRMTTGSALIVHEDRKKAVDDIENRLKALAGALRDGVLVGKGLIDEQPAPDAPSLLDTLLEIAISAAIAATAGIIGAGVAGFLKKMPELKKSPLVDGPKDASKAIFKGVADKGLRKGSLGASVQAGQRRAQRDPNRLDFSSAPKAAFLDAQLTMVRDFQDGINNTFLNETETLERLDIRVLNKVVRQLDERRDGVKDKQAKIMVREWVNLCARLKHGAPEDSTRDAVLGGFVANATGVLQIDCTLSMGQGAKITGFRMPGMHANIRKQFDKKPVNEILVNKVYNLRFGRYGMSIHQRPDSGALVLPGRPFHKEVLIAHALGRKTIPEDPKGLDPNRAPLVTLRSIHGDAKAEEAARTILGTLQNAEVELD
jgi:hypothetical protein